jgi:hypothetical protein
MTAHGTTTVANLWDGVGDGNDGCWAIKARDERHHPRWLMAIGSAWHLSGEFPAASLLIVVRPVQCKCPGLETLGHVLIETKRQSEFNEAAGLTRWGDFSA